MLLSPVCTAPLFFFIMAILKNSNGAAPYMILCRICCSCMLVHLVRRLAIQKYLHVAAHTIQYETIQNNIHCFCLRA
jgi:hypothetical protein